MAKKAAVINGDGTGPELVNAMLHVLKECNTQIELVLCEAGSEQWEKHGGQTYIPEETQKIMEEHYRPDLPCCANRSFGAVPESELPEPPVKVTESESPEPPGGGCLIATAAFGSEMAPQVQFLRELRDNTVLQTESGTSFMTAFNQFYYSFSPAIADYERENTVFKETVKLTLTPLLVSLTLLQHADIDSEYDMLGYGIGIILLNIGMYFVAPAVLITKIRSFYKLQ